MQAVFCSDNTGGALVGFFQGTVAAGIVDECEGCAFVLVDAGGDGDVFACRRDRAGVVDEDGVKIDAVVIPESDRLVLAHDVERFGERSRQRAVFARDGSPMPDWCRAGLAAARIDDEPVAASAGLHGLLIEPGVENGVAEGLVIGDDALWIGRIWDADRPGAVARTC